MFQHEALSSARVPGLERFNDVRVLVLVLVLGAGAMRLSVVLRNDKTGQSNLTAQVVREEAVLGDLGQSHLEKTRESGQFGSVSGSTSPILGVQVTPHKREGLAAPACCQIRGDGPFESPAHLEDPLHVAFAGPCHERPYASEVRR